jgi:hypothetical protein
VRGENISLNGAPVVHYKPGQSLAIPVEGGGTLYLKGEVLDHKPKIAFGLPLEPPAGEMILRSPVLSSEDRLLGEENGATAIAPKEGDAINFRVGASSTFLFSLKPFAGAVQGQANWGEVTFKLDGQRYRLVAAAPITAGDQPRTVWVRHDVTAGGNSDGPSLGSGPIPN